MEFKYYSDAGHGWLEVPLATVRELDIAHLISRCSYRSGERVFLEQDCDLAIFLARYQSKHGGEPVIKEMRVAGRSFIRDLAKYAA